MTSLVTECFYNITFWPGRSWWSRGGRGGRWWGWWGWRRRWENVRRGPDCLLSLQTTISISSRLEIFSLRMDDFLNLYLWRNELKNNYALNQLESQTITELQRNQESARVAIRDFPYILRQDPPPPSSGPSWMPGLPSAGPRPSSCPGTRPPPAPDCSCGCRFGGTDL